MTMDLREINMAIEITCLAFSVALLVSYLMTKTGKNRLGSILIWMLLANCVALVCDALAWGFAGRPDPRLHPLLVALNLLGYIASYLQLELTAYYIVSYISLRSPGAGRRFFAVFSVVVFAFMGLLVVSQFTGVVYRVNRQNLFDLGPLYSFTFLLTAAGLAALIALVVVYRRSFSGRDFTVILLFPLITLMASLVEMLFVDLMVSYTITGVALVFLYMTVQYQQEKQAMERENQAKISIMLSQIQPHFLYNSLTAIGQLCEVDPPKAKAAVTNFAHYMRGNLESLRQRRLISFRDELEHVETYLALQQMRYGGLVRVEKEIGVDDFYLPPLTVQPIVENAVVHGLLKREEGGTVRLRTEREGAMVRITVADDGVGFGPPAVPAGPGRAHVGIENVRGRLAVQCGGTLELESVPGRGTVAVITLPYGQSQAKEAAR